MNFFEHQQQARRNTRVMVVLYALAVLGVVVAVDAVMAYIWIAARGLPVPGWFLVVGALVTALFISCASYDEMLRLRRGGEAIADKVGARLIQPDTLDLSERRLLNVVEEMAIASGVRVPKVYLMDKERGINAFAAGHDVSNAVIVVTRGALATLNRDELQGLIGHEFSHIVNADILLNLQMMGVLAGLVLIGATGGFMLRSLSTLSGGNDWRSRSGKDSSSGDLGPFGAFLGIIGLALLGIGSVGLFFARLIKATLSREREFLADASSVQFTRNPDAIAGALDQIRATSRGTLIDNRYAEAVSHMFFGQGIRTRLGWVFDTHPAVEKRIRRVSPGFQATGYRQRRPAVNATVPAGQEMPAAVAGFAGIAAARAPAPAGTRASDVRHAWARSPSQSAALVGTLDAGKVDSAKQLLEALPATLRERMRQPAGASAALVALMLAAKDTVMEEQLTAVKSAGGAQLADAARALAPEMRSVGLAFQLPVIDLALPALKHAPAQARAQALAALEAVILADRRVSLHEFAVLTLARSQLEPRPKAGAVEHRSVAAVRDEALVLLSLVAWAGARRGPEGEPDYAVAFAAGTKEMRLEGASPVARDALDLAAAIGALEKLRDLAPMAKATLVKGLFAAITADGTIRILEAELMRMVGAAVDCPLPPLLDDIDPAILAA